jgi:hypothetical protein
MASPAPAVGKFGGLTLGGLAQEILGGAALMGAQGLIGGLSGAIEPSAPQGSSGSKYMITLQDVKEIEKYVASENFRRSMLNNFGADLPLLDADAIIREREAQLRQSADEAGAREYAKEQLSVPRAVVPAIAQAAGVGAQAASNLGQQFLESYLARPNIDPAIQEAARAV